MSTTHSLEQKYLTRRVLSMQESQTMRISNLAATMKAEGKDIVSLSAGEPDFPTPDNVNQAAIAAINAGFTRYTTRLLSATGASRPLPTLFSRFAKRVMR